MADDGSLLLDGGKSPLTQRPADGFKLMPPISQADAWASFVASSKPKGRGTRDPKEALEASVLLFRSSVPQNFWAARCSRMRVDRRIEQGLVVIVKGVVNFRDFSQW